MIISVYIVVFAVKAAISGITIMAVDIVRYLSYC